MSVVVCCCYRRRYRCCSSFLLFRVVACCCRLCYGDCSPLSFVLVHEGMDMSSMTRPRAIVVDVLLFAVVL